MSFVERPHAVALACFENAIDGMDVRCRWHIDRAQRSKSSFVGAAQLFELRPVFRNIVDPLFAWKEPIRRMPFLAMCPDVREKAICLRLGNDDVAIAHAECVEGRVVEAIQIITEWLRPKRLDLPRTDGIRWETEQNLRPLRHRRSLHGRVPRHLRSMRTEPYFGSMHSSAASGPTVSQSHRRTQHPASSAGVRQY